MRSTTPSPHSSLRPSHTLLASLSLLLLSFFCLSPLADAQVALWPEPTAVQLTQLQGCLLGQQLRVVSSSLSDSSTYFRASQSDNTIFHYNPFVIVYATSTEQVQAAVRCAAQNGNIAVAARSGGHSFGGFGSGGRDGSIVIDLSSMNTTTSYPEKRTAEIWTGARLGDVVKDLWSQKDGKMALAHGTCPTVGVGGHSTCGGFGPMSRAWGMTMDHILEADVVLADGSLVTATETQNRELLWALKGAASYVGILTRILFRTHDASRPVVFFEYRWTPSLRTADDAAVVYTAVQAFAQSKWASEQFGFHIQLRRPLHGDPEPREDRPVSITVRGTFLGDRSEFDASASHLWKQFAKHRAPLPDSKTERTVTYLESMEEWDDFGPEGNKLDTQLERTQHNHFIARTTLTLDHSKGIKRSSFLSLLEHVFATAKPSEHETRLPDGQQGWFQWNLYVEFYGGKSAAYRTKSAIEESAYPWRDGLWLMQAAVGTAASGTLPHGAHGYLDRLNEKIHAAVSSSGIKTAGYSCYLDPDLPEEEWREAYYGPSLKRLEALKAKVDPTNLLRNPQSLGNRTEIEARWAQSGTSRIRRSSSPWM